jgi:glutamine amidotransferase
MKNLNELRLIELLRDEVILKKRPFLGICLGMQLLCREGYENGICKGLGWIPAVAKQFDEGVKGLRLPHIGWNEVFYKDSALFTNLSFHPTFYFAHSYHCVCDTEEVISARCNYGYDFVASIQKDNIFATQFHPEKSQLNGLQLLKNFTEYNNG